MIMIKFQFSHDRILFIKYWGDEWRSDHILRFLQNTSQRLNLGVPAPVNMVASVVGWCDVQQLPSLMVLFFIRENELSQIHLQRIDNMSPVDNKESLLIWFKSGEEAELPAITLSNGSTWHHLIFVSPLTNSDKYQLRWLRGFLSVRKIKSPDHSNHDHSHINKDQALRFRLSDVWSIYKYMLLLSRF